MARPSDAAIAIGIGAVAIATRWALRGHDLFSWDSGMLASGIVSYEFEPGFPHPPYYPLTIAAGKVLAPWTGPVGALVALAVIASGVMAAFTYLTARRLCGPLASGFAAAVVVLSPTALSNGIAPLSYALEGAASAVVAWAAWAFHSHRSLPRLLALATATSLAVGIRPSSLFLVAPLAIWAVWGDTVAMAWGAVTGAIVTAAWLVPAVVAGGGLGPFLAGNHYQGHFVVFAHTVLDDGWPAVADNARHLAAALRPELPFLAATATLAAVTALAWWPHRPARPAGAFLAAWLAPSLLFFVFVYAGWPVYPSGYVLASIPALAVAAAVVMQAMAAAIRQSAAPRPVVVATAVLLVAVVAMPLAWAAQWPEATSGQREADAWARSWSALERDYPANETALLTYYGWFWCRLDHPDYLTWGLHPYWTPAGAVQVQVVQTRHLQDEPHSLRGPADPSAVPPHAVPSWVKHIVVVYGPPSRGETSVLKDGVPVTQRILDSGMHVTIIDPSAVTSIEQAVRWFDDAGRPVPA